VLFFDTFQASESFFDFSQASVDDGPLYVDFDDICDDITFDCITCVDDVLLTYRDGVAGWHVVDKSPSSPSLLRTTDDLDD
jgi:hypothetical protein